MDRHSPIQASANDAIHDHAAAEPQRRPPRHSGIGLHTPASVHYGTATEIRAHRANTLDAAYTANPDRFRCRRPTPPKLPTVAWINDPSREALIQNK